MGFASGLPILLTGSTLQFWMRQSNVSLQSISLFGLVGIAYSIKFLWAPVLDRVALPWVTARLGRRRSWAIVIQLGLIGALIGLGQGDPVAAPWGVAAWAVLVAFLAASQDIVIDAYRVDLLSPEEQGPGASASQIGYRFGMIAAGAGALFAVDGLGWSGAYALMAGLMSIGIVTILLTPEPPDRPVRTETTRQWINSAVIAPFADFMTRSRWPLILAFVVLYRLGDAVAGQMAAPFYVDIGFSRAEYASVSKVFGICASMAGISLGGLAAYRLGIGRALMLALLLQIVSNLTYVLQAWAGHDMTAFVATIGAEQLAGGMMGTVMVTYLSGLCSPAYTATQYALLSAVATIGYRVAGAYAGRVAESVGWVPFFTGSIALVMPAIALLVWLMRHQALLERHSHGHLEDLDRRKSAL
jgi:PAT family beta-lactamase induction signal transducer AmpG